MMVRVYSSLACMYVHIGLMTRAAEAARAALDLSPRVFDPESLAELHYNVAQLLLSELRFEEATRSFERAEYLYLQLDLRRELASARLARGYSLARSDHLEQAKTELQEAIEIFVGIGASDSAAHAFAELARIHRREGVMENAQALLERCISFLEPATPDNAAIRAWAHRQMALTLVATDRMGAEREVRAALALYHRVERHLEEAATMDELAELLAARGEGAPAFEIFRPGMKLLSHRLKPTP